MPGTTSAPSGSLTTGSETPDASMSEPARALTAEAGAGALGTSEIHAT
jgi:hypothetical protein